MLEAFQKYLRNSEVIMGAGVIFILALIVVPMPGFAIDALITVSLLSGILILLTALSSKTPAEFSVFPTLLLITTLFRLAVNISTTRMILTKGPSLGSALIQAFGTFVVGGSGGLASYVIGVIIFLILTLVQIMVITKGATRISEVAARFALDSMPGKQLAIDSEQQQGHIDEKEARRRREGLQREMNFYGAMDGASKFVQGDVRVGLIIVAINIIGGLVVGIGIRGEGFREALETYVRFTIGEGLAAQIPALLITTATGVIVTRSVGEQSLPSDLKKQLFANPKILYVVGVVMFLGGFIPGFPTIAMFFIGGLFLFLATRIERSLQAEQADEKKREAERGGEAHRPESYLDHLKTETLEVEIGYNLIPLVDPKSGGTLLDQISRLRRRFAMDIGLIVPPVRIRDNMNLEPGEYVIKLNGSAIGSSKLEADRLMAIDTGRVTSPIPDVKSFTEPTYNLNAYWIQTDQKADAESRGFDVVDPSTVIATHLSNMIENNSSEIMGRQEVKNIIDSIKETNPVVVDEVLSEKKVTMGQIQAVLQGLLKENVSIKNMAKILETIANHAERTGRDPSMLTEQVRQTLRRQIVAELVTDANVLHCITIDPQIDRRLREGIHRDPEEGLVMALKPEFQMAIRDSLMSEYAAARKADRHPVFLTSRAIRAGIFYIMERQVPARTFSVLAHEEIPPNVKLEVESQVTIRSRQEEDALA